MAKIYNKGRTPHVSAMPAPVHPCASLDARLTTSAVLLAADEHLLAGREINPGGEEAIGGAGVRRRANSGNRRNDDCLSEGSRSCRGEKRDRSRNQDFGASHQTLPRLIVPTL